MMDPTSTVSPAPAPRFLIMDLLVFTAWLAVVAWCMTLTGNLRDHVLIQVVGMFILSLLAFSCFRFRKEIWLIFNALANLIAAVLFSAEGGMTTCIFAVALVIVYGLISIGRLNNLRVFLYSLVFASIGAMGFSVWLGFDRHNDMMEFRRSYPIVDIAQRLSYEASKPKTRSNSRLVEDELLAVDEERSFSPKSGLRQLHSRIAEEFAMAQGFGVSRLESFNHYVPTYVESDPVPFCFEEASTKWNSSTLGKQHSEFHAAFIKDRWDYVAVLEPLRSAVGIVEHGFKRHPVPTLPLERLELISLYRFSEPRSYVLKSLPRMEDLKGDDVPTRALDSFENQALGQLWTKQNVVIEEGSDVIRMLGAIRASTGCLQCHQATNGELLGAFTYTIRP